MPHKAGRPPQQAVPTLFDFRRVWSLAQLLYKFDDNQDLDKLHDGIHVYCVGWGVEIAYDADGQIDYLRTLARMAAHGNNEGQKNWKGVGDG